MYKKLTLTALFALMSLGTAQAGTLLDAHDGPVVITAEDGCSGCKMIPKKYPGPKGEVRFKDNSVGKFCSTRCMFCYSFRDGNADKIARYYVHDIGATDWSDPDDRQFIDAKKAWFVYGTSKKATMGPAVASFSSKRAAEEHIQKFGGKLYRFSDISAELIKCPKRKKPMP